MSEIKALGKLKDLVQDINEREINDHIIIERYSDGSTETGISRDWVCAWRDAALRQLREIEREIAERYMELPLDEDGVDYSQLRIANLLAQRGKLQADLNTCELDNESLRTENSELCDEIDALTARRSELESENRELRKRLAIAEAEAKRTDDGWMRLPVDADGKPWYEGDVTENGDTVRAVTEDGFIIYTFGLCDLGSVVRHQRERTIEDVLREVVSITDHLLCKEEIEAYAAEICELMGVVSE